MFGQIIVATNVMASFNTGSISGDVWVVQPRHGSIWTVIGH